jgi:hypothetical protein
MGIPFPREWLGVRKRSLSLFSGRRSEVVTQLTRESDDCSITIGRPPRATGDYSSIATYSSALISKLASEGSDSFTFTSQPCP